MTTMRHRFDKDNKENNEKEETPEERAARVERLLDASARWEPDRDVPDDLVARAAARIERERNASFWYRFRYSQPWWGVSALGLTAAAALVFVALRLNSVPDRTLYRTPPGDVASLWQQEDDSLVPGAENPRYRTVSGIPEGVSRPVVFMPTISPSGYTSKLAPPEQNYTVAVVVGEPAAHKKSPVPTHRNPSLAANRAGSSRKYASPFKSQRRKPTKVSGPKDHEVEELALPPVWQEETVTRQDYRVAVPVMLTPKDGDPNNQNGVPAVVELTFEPQTVPLRSTFDE